MIGFDFGVWLVGVFGDVYVAVVERIVDGGTLRVVAPPEGAGDGLPDGGSVRVRLLNVDAPELPRDGKPVACLAEEATDRFHPTVAAAQERARDDGLGVWGERCAVP